MKTGRHKQRFDGLRRCKNGSANHVTKTLLGFLQEKRIDIRKVMSFGSDGANVMVGVHNGVATQLQRLNPRMVICHGAAHNLALAGGHASDAVPYLRDKLFPTVSSIYVLYHYSAKKTDCLADKQENSEGPVLSMKRSELTRWSSRRDATNQCHKSFSSS